MQSSGRPLLISTPSAQGGPSSVAWRWRSVQSPARDSADGKAGGGYIQRFHRPAFREFRHRGRDRPPDLGYLISAASDVDLDEARTSAAMIEERGFNRGQGLSEDLRGIIGQARK
jgi:hypothetical protein